jgi:transaldolase/glucose-6-phosphate isomerase
MSTTNDSMQQNQIYNLGEYQTAVERRLTMWENHDFANRFWSKDHTLWSPMPLPELANRMGWLDIFEPMHEHLKSMFDFAEAVRAEGFRHLVLLGMGGSSLAPEVFHKTFGAVDGHPSLIVLDSTHPESIRAVESRIDLAKTIFIVSSKSGTTTETSSFFYHFWHRIGETSATPGRQFAAISDPGTPLMRMAAERGFRKIFEGPPEVGGRYSALTLFGLAPAAAVGIDSHQILDRGWDLAGASASYLPENENPSLLLGAALGELALAGRDKVTFFTTPRLASFPSWLEQLIAESTGKDNKGIIPIVGEVVEEPWAYRKDRLFVCYTLASEPSEDLEQACRALEAAGHPVIYFRLNDKYDLGQEIFRWEMAVAAAGAVLGINPFDQPDVQLAKELARQAMDQKGAPVSKGGPKADRMEVETLQIVQKIVASKTFNAFIGGARIGDYISLQAYLSPNDDTEAALGDFRLALRDRLKLATTFGWGPRFLHSTGQLHKGGPNTGLYIQLIDEPEKDLPVSETNYSFGQLIQAQALGDYRALRQRGRRVLRINLGHDTPKGLSLLFDLLG